jgi:Domain of unknown function (DUF4145)
MCPRRTPTASHRCWSHSFDLRSYTQVGYQYNWQSWYEAFCICRHCGRSTVFVLSEKGIDEAEYIKEHGLSKSDVAANGLIKVEDYISRKNAAAQPAPEHLPQDIKAAFDEGAICLAVGCVNAAATMFRLCINIAIRSLLPKADEKGLNAKIRRNLDLRMPWLFDNGLLPEAMSELSTYIKEDGNDGAHAGPLDKGDAEDLLDFTTALLERMYTEPERLRLAKERRDWRRAPKA